MDFKKLDQLLLKLSESEKRYLYQPQRELLTQSTYHFSYKERLKNHPFVIRKQSRFIPVPEHFTDVIELNYVYQGHSKHLINGQEILLSEGDLILVDTKTRHAASTIGKDDLVISINISQDFFKQYFLNVQQKNSVLSRFLFQAISNSRHHNQYLIFRAEQSKERKLLFQQLLWENYFPSSYQYEIQSHLLQLIMLHLIKSFSVQANGTITQDPHQQLILEVLTYIDANYSSTSLSECAKYFGYNSSYFSNLITKTAGSSFKQLLQDRRLEATLFPLTSTHQSIHQIALEAGFSNLNQYYKIFKERYQMTPAQFRKEKQ